MLVRIALALYQNNKTLPRGYPNPSPKDWNTRLLSISTLPILVGTL